MNNNEQKQLKVEISESTTPEEKLYYMTSDIAHAAVLMTCGRKLMRTQPKFDKKGRGFKKVEFVFRREGVDDIILNYTNSDLNIDAKTLLDNYRSLKGASLSHRS